MFGSYNPEPRTLKYDVPEMSGIPYYYRHFIKLNTFIHVNIYIENREPTSLRGSRRRDAEKCQP